MANVKDNIEIFERYNKAQKMIDACNSLISELKTKKDKNHIYFGGYQDLQEKLGGYLHERIGQKIVTLIEAEIVVLKAEQEKLEIKC